MGEALVKGVARSVDDVGRRIEIRLPNLEMNNVAPLCLQRPCLHKDFEGGLGAETSHALGEAKILGLMHGTDYARTTSSLNHQLSTFAAGGSLPHTAGPIRARERFS